MLKIDTHAHILPPDWPNLAEKYGDDRFPVMVQADGRHRIYKDGKFFREVWANAFDPEVRIADYAKFGVDVQVVSTVPVLFSYWAKPSQALRHGRWKSSMWLAIDAVKKQVTRERKRTVPLTSVVDDDRDSGDRAQGDVRDEVKLASSQLLSDRQRRIIDMSFDGWSVQDISRELALGTERVSDEKYKAVRKLREFFARQS